LELLYEKLLKRSKNLLAFSAGSDSSALFFLLLEHDIPFDIAIVDYGTRAQSIKEIAHAKDLAQKYGKKIYISHAPSFPSNFEARARSFRYHFFETIIAKEGYDTLLTAHHLDDQFEWFLMQLSKGAGLGELVGLEPLLHKRGYKIIRPLLFHTKKEILAYLANRQIPYFHDESNEDTSYFRNYIRHHYAKPFMEEFALGLKRSFAYLLEDKKALLSQLSYRQIHDLYIAAKPSTPGQTMRVIDRICKKLGYLASASQKREILRQKEGVLAGSIAFGITQDLIYIAPHSQERVPKKIKERLRRAKIPAPLRPYIATAGIGVETIEQNRRLLQKNRLRSDRRSF